MIADVAEMKAIEAAGRVSSAQLMERAGAAIAEALQAETAAGSRILFLCGKGNNGGDGFAACRLLQDRIGQVYLADELPATKEAAAALRKLASEKIIKTAGLKKAIAEADAIVDAVYGFGYHGSLPQPIRKLFELVSSSGKKVYSIDINSGCEADTGICDSGAIHSWITYALDCYKPFHMLRKDHGMFHSVRLLSLDLPHPRHTKYHEMNEELFFANFPQKAENAYKGSAGKTLLIGGCYGMAGAVCLNILGAKTVGASYINVALPEEIYAAAASHFLTPVFHPFGHQTMNEVVQPLVSEAAAIGFGSGAVYMDHKEQCLDLVLQNSRSPVVLDAEALRLLKQNTYILRFVHCPVILTPHLGEFAAIVNQPVEAVRDHKIATVLAFARDYKVIVVLKGPHTLVASPSGDLYINQSGNQALAQAGSGDLLTGIMTAMLSLTRDVYTAVVMAVWLHGYLADLGLQEHSIQAFPLTCYPDLMDRLLRRHQR